MGAHPEGPRALADSSHDRLGGRSRQLRWRFTSCLMQLRVDDGGGLPHPRGPAPWSSPVAHPRGDRLWIMHLWESVEPKGADRYLIHEGSPVVPGDQDDRDQTLT